jgi:2-iminoacetate synthase
VLEEIAQRARQVTLARFGRTVQLYVPLYLSNHCVGHCPYCGFRRDQSIKRRTLTPDEIAQEAEAIGRTGMRHILLVAGESPKQIDIDYLSASIALLKKSFSNVAVEVAPLEEDGYKKLVAAGVDGVTLYQETYDSTLYNKYHSRGPKADYDYRLDALDRAGAAGVRNLTVGALWGLSKWRHEALRLGLHAHYLQKKWWKSQILAGLPRLHDVPSDFAVPYPLDDRSFVHIIVALRVFFEDLGIVISTRESPELREKLVLLGTTHMSAGSKTEPGGYCAEQVSGSQFPVSDHRSPEEVARSLTAMGYDPVWKDWDPSFTMGGGID